MRQSIELMASNLMSCVQQLLVEEDMARDTSLGCIKSESAGDLCNLAENINENSLDRNPLSPHKNQVDYEGGSTLKGEEQPLGSSADDPKSNSSAEEHQGYGIHKSSPLEINNNYHLEQGHPPERLLSTSKTIYPNSQERLCQAMTSIELDQKIVHYNCKNKLQFTEDAQKNDNSYNSGRGTHIVSEARAGLEEMNFQWQLQPERESQSISIVYANGQQSLDLICKDKAQADSRCLGLRVAISKCHHSRFLGAPKSRRGAQSCINSPASYM